jgi:hypothetical protein
MTSPLLKDVPNLFTPLSLILPSSQLSIKNLSLQICTENLFSFFLNVKRWPNMLKI